jgi:aspartate kinase
VARLGLRPLQGRAAQGRVNRSASAHGRSEPTQLCKKLLADASINVDMIVQNVSADGATTDLTFTVPAADYERARDTIANAKAQIGYARLDGATDVSKVSVIGVGMRSHAGVAAEAFRALADRGINIRAITTSEIKFSLLIDAAYTELAIRTLHSLYGLDRS